MAGRRLHNVTLQHKMEYNQAPRPRFAAEQ
jgi:hypothetical protein